MTPREKLLAALADFSDVSAIVGGRVHEWREASPVELSAVLSAVDEVVAAERGEPVGYAVVKTHDLIGNRCSPPRIESAEALSLSAVMGAVASAFGGQVIVPVALYPLAPLPSGDAEMEEGRAVGFRGMVVCPECRNKRCPGAIGNPCTGSNAPGQPGSAFADWPSDTEMEEAGQITLADATGVSE